MKLAILGATGPSGVALVNKALAAGHEVLALVRNPDGVTTTHEKLQVHKIDLTQEETLIPHLKGCDSVMSCLGSRTLSIFSSVSVYSDSVKVIVSSMRKSNVNRFICMTAFGTKATAGESFVVAWILRPIFLRSILADMSRMEDYLEAECQDINYTVVRPPGLKNDESTGQEIKVNEGQYVPNARGGIPRQDVAKFMLQCLETKEYDKKMMAIITV